MAADRVPMGHRLEAVRKVLRQAGPAGLPMAEVAKRGGVPARLMSVLLANYKRAGHVHRVGPTGAVRWHLGGGVRCCACTGAGFAGPRQLVTPAQAPRLQAPMRRPGAPLQSAARPVLPVPRQPAPEASVPPDGVRIIRCPSGRDTRYEVPDSFEGPFTQEWRRRRGESHGA